MQRTWCKHLPAAELLIKGGRVVDPESGVDAVNDVLIKKGKVAEVGKDLEAGKGARVIDAAGLLVLPGFVDLHAHFRTPGREDEEDIATASAAAAAGGYVAAFGMANTDPVVDSAGLLKGLARQAGVDAVVPVGFFAAVTKGLEGQELTEMGELGAAGAVGFSDDGLPLPNAAITRRALQYVKVSKRFVAIHAQDDSLFKGGQMHEGPASARLGLTGIPFGPTRPHRHPFAL
jgi:dihydroorotase